MSTWASRASAPTDSPPNSDSNSASPAPADAPPSARPTPSSSVPRTAPISKANASDNWRANARPNSAPKSADPPARARAASKGNAHAATSALSAASGAATPAHGAAQDDEEGGWETVEKKDKPAPTSRLGNKKSFAKDGHKKGVDGRKSTSTEESSSANENGAGSKGKGAAGRTRAGSSSTAKGDKKTATSSGRSTLKPASWADEEDNGILPSPNFGASAPPATAASSDAAVEVLVLPPSQAPSPNEEKSQKEVEPAAPAAGKKVSSAPSVNVWSIRKDQLAQAAEPSATHAVAASESSAGASNEQAAQVEAKKSGQKKKQEQKPSAVEDDAPPAADDGAMPSTGKSSPSSSKNASSVGWSSTPTPAVSGSSKQPLVVAGEDATKWPAPEDAVKQDEAKAKPAKEDRPSGQQQAGGKKKKGDKSKWIPIKVEITVNGPAPGQSGKGKAKATRASGAHAAGGAEKKATHSAQAQGKGKATAGAAAPSAKTAGSAGQGKGKKAATAGPNARSSPLDTSADAEGVIRPFGGATSGVAVAGSVKSPSASAGASEPNGAAPSQTATPSTNGGETSQLPRQPPAFGSQQQAQFAGRGRGRGGLVRGRGGARGGANGVGFSRHIHQQHVAALAAGYVPVPVELDGNGNPIVDQHGHPVVAPGASLPAQGQVSAQAASFDPRMLDPTRYWLLGQLEWWFSIDNLCRDLFLRQSMDASGWISVPLIASFNRIKNLTSDVAIVVETMRMTPVLEVSPKGRFVRLAQTWPEWILPNAQKNGDVEKDFEEARVELKELHERKEKEGTATKVEGDNSATATDEAKDKSKDDEKTIAETGASASGLEPEADSPADSKSIAAPVDIEDVIEADRDANETVEEKDASSGSKVAQSQEGVTLAVPAVSVQSAVPRKEALSPREAPRTISPKATPAQPMLDTAVASVQLGASTSP